MGFARAGASISQPDAVHLQTKPRRSYRCETGSGISITGRSLGEDTTYDILCIHRQVNHPYGDDLILRAAAIWVAARYDHLVGPDNSTRVASWFASSLSCPIPGCQGTRVATTLTPYCRRDMLIERRSQRVLGG